MAKAGTTAGKGIEPVHALQSGMWWNLLGDSWTDAFDACSMK